MGDALTPPPPPSALARWEEIVRRIEGRRLALFLDYDGTLAPIAPRPELATLPSPVRDLLARLARRFPVTVLSGRGREDVAALVGLPELTYAGGHGFDIAGPAVRREIGDGIPELVERAAARLNRDLRGIEGALVESKRFTVAVHYRLVRAEDLPAVERAVDAVLADHPELRKAHGKKVFELRPALDWDKGEALLFLLDTLAPGDPAAVPLYIGDDATDEDAFRATAGRGIGILVAAEPRPTAAAYRLRGPEEVRELLERLATG